ncbi:MAG: hypothetical protein OEY92_02950 [Elusimicrobiota bacterium]|nr:hypothetical protein [Elusimicrobiota bacterium]
MKPQFRHILEELQHHLPYTIFSVAVGMMTLGSLTVLIEGNKFPQASQNLFHIFHPLHILFSAAATTAMFWRYDKKILKAISIGFVGAVGLCGISDIFIPFFAGYLLGVKMHLHVCILTDPMIVLPFLFFGIFVGFVLPTVIESTIFSHAAHVLISSMASIFYLVSFGLTEWIPVGGMVFIYMVLAVMIPCCTSDIVFPLLLVRKVG